MGKRWLTFTKRVVRWVVRVWKITQIAETILSLIDLL